jgi:hypothetical protein
LEAGGLEVGQEGGAAVQVGEVRPSAFEERVQRWGGPFDADELDDLVDMARQVAAFAVDVCAGAVAVDDQVDLAQPVECLLGVDLVAGGEGEADEVAECVLG